MKLITNKRHNGLINPDFNKYLLKPVPVTKMTKDEAVELEKILIEQCNALGGYGLSANQLGISKRACVIRSSMTELEYQFLMNPIIIEKSEDYFIYYESCLSLPKTFIKPIRTYRHMNVKIHTDNLGELVYAVNPQKDSEREVTEFITTKNSWNEVLSLDTLQTIIVQHEIDHLDGFTIQDRNSLNTTIKKTNNFGRNDKVIMKSPAGEIVEIKYKKANDYFLKGYEIV